jgi:PTS system fructose-specific IIC component
MARIIAVTACPTGIAHTYMAAEALKKTAALMGHSIRVETQGAAGARDILNDADLAAAELVILAADTHVEMTRFAGKAVHETTTSVAIRDPRGVIEAALALIGISAERQPKPEPAPAAQPARNRPPQRKDRGDHRLPDRHRAYLHGCRGLEEGRCPAWLRDQGRDAGLGGRQESRSPPRRLPPPTW